MTDERRSPTRTRTRSGPGGDEGAARAIVAAAQRFALVQVRMTREMEHVTGVDPAHSVVLRAIAAGAVRVSDVAGALQQSVSTASRLVDAMVREGLLTRQEAPDDRRAVVLGLTRSGRVAQERVDAYTVGLVQRVLEQMPEGDADAFVQGFAAFAEGALLALPEDDAR